MNPKNLSLETPQEGFCRIHFQSMSLHYIEHYSQVMKMMILVMTFDSNIVDITFYRLSEVVTEDYTHCTLISCSRIL